MQVIFLVTRENCENCHSPGTCSGLFALEGSTINLTYQSCRMLNCDENIAWDHNGNFSTVSVETNVVFLTFLWLYGMYRYIGHIL